MVLHFVAQYVLFIFPGCCRNYYAVPSDLDDKKENVPVLALVFRQSATSRWLAGMKKWVPLQKLRENLTMGKTQREIIHQSHERSKKLGIVRGSDFRSRLLSANLVRKLLKENEGLINAAAPIVESLFDFLKGSGFFIILTDCSGRILEIEGDTVALDEAARQNLIPGALMDERSIGTNSVGIAISENGPIQVTATEHFLSEFHQWTCSACPVHDTTGQIAGVLNLTGKSELVHPHTLGLVVAAASAIEYRINTIDIQEQLHKSNQFAFAMMNNLSYGLFAMSLDDHILWVNDSACRSINTRRLELIDRPIESIFPGWPGVKETILKNEPYADEEGHFNLPKIKERFLFSAYLISTKENEVLGYLLSFRELSGIYKMINKLGEHRTRYTFSDYIGDSQKITELIKYCKTIAKNPSTVLIRGESGTGKEIIAQSIHSAGPRKNQAFVALNCGAMTASLIESELFGYADGAFTGAKKGGKAGKFELANNGTLFLDEIGEMPLEMQVKLLRTIQEQTITRVGSNKPVPVNVRIIAATNKDLDEEVRSGRFRLDLYYRLNVFEVHIPPLRERREDILPLVRHFLKKISSRLDIQIPELKPEFQEALMQYNWPGNIRELENLMERAVILKGNLDRNQISHLTEAFSLPETERELRNSDKDEILSLEEIEKTNILKTIRHFNSNISRSAEALGISRNTLYLKMKKYDLLHVSTFGE